MKQESGDRTRTDGANLLEKIVSLAKRRGFIFPGSEIYGGLAGFYDFGPLGAELKFNIKQAWWKANVLERDDIVGLSAAIIMNPRAWEASGHVTGFSDPLVECAKCNKRFRSDHVTIKFKKDSKGKVLQGADVWVCESCGAENDNGKKGIRQFNLMFKTFVGPVEDSAAGAYLRPETAGGIFVNFKNVLDTMRVKIPFGIAQIGRAFRNEINPKDFIFRTREFEQMELEYFVRPGRDDAAFDEWVAGRLAWYQRIGLKNVHVREQAADERAHYSKATKDIEYDFPFGRKEIEGIANRGDFDLTAHAKYSGKDLSYFDEETKKPFVPHVIEPSAGVERILFALLCDVYHEEDNRVVLQFAPPIAPYKVAVFPLLANKPPFVEKARAIYRDLKQTMTVAWDDRGNIGKRYYAQDEIGTPWCVTVDFQTLEDDTVTVRDRDTMKQERVATPELAIYFQERLKS